MSNGLENATLNSECLDPHKDDHEHSMDDESTPGTQEVNNERMSDPELSPSERVSSNNELSENPYPEDECDDDPEQSTEPMTDFLKLLPYLLLVQRSIEASNGSSMNQEAHDDSSNGDVSSNNNLYESQRKQSAMHLESLRNHIQSSSLRYLFSNFQQLPSPGITNGFHQNVENQFNNPDNELMSDFPADEPLDLTQKSNHKSRGESKTVRDERIMKPTVRTERGYTIEDLEAALKDIKSGKLGTRRAAVIYGIPRSTLRNKVYKMGKNLPSKVASYEMRGEVGLPRQWNGNGNISRSLLANAPGLESNSDIRTKNRELEEDCEIDEAGSESGRASSIGANAYFGVGNIFSSSKEANGDSEESVAFMDASCHSIFGGSRGKNYSQRGRHDSSSSVSQFNNNYPCVQNSVLNYENMYSDSSSLGKKSRPKRGKYRNYDRDALTKAVQAVQNGEMSVHRAGSFFGVPHSTLEYKVKERHLLRQAKNKGKTTVKSTSTAQQSTTAGCSSVTSLSPTIMPDSNDSSSSFQRALPSDLHRNLLHYSNSENTSLLRNRWNNPLELLGLGIRDPLRNGNDNNLPSESDKNDSFQDHHQQSLETHDDDDLNSNEQFHENKPIDLLDLTKKT